MNRPLKPGGGASTTTNTKGTGAAADPGGSSVELMLDRAPIKRTGRMRIRDHRLATDSGRNPSSELRPSRRVRSLALPWTNGRTSLIVEMPGMTT